MTRTATYRGVNFTKISHLMNLMIKDMMNSRVMSKNMMPDGHNLFFISVVSITMKPGFHSTQIRHQFFWQKITFKNHKSSPIVPDGVDVDSVLY